MTNQQSPFAIEASGLKKRYGKLTVLDGIDLRVERGTVFALLGPNGAGKTTTVRILTTLLQSDSGSATIEGYDVKSQADEVRGVIGLTGQYAAVDEYLSGRENLRMMGRLYHLSGADSDRRAEELLVQFDLVDAAERRAETYSGGMRRRLDLAASLIAAPPVIFLDEPTTGLDPRSRIKMWDVIKKLVADGVTILLTTQYLDEADQLADRVAVIDTGKVIAEGTSDELKSQIGDDRVEFTYTGEATLRRAAEVLRDLEPTVNEKKMQLTIPNARGVEGVRDMLDRLGDNGASAAGINIHKPTLDDVFLKLTGKTTTNEQDGEEES